jgi:hypothetical protein
MLLGIQKSPDKMPMGENSNFSPKGITIQEVMKHTNVIEVCGESRMELC